MASLIFYLRPSTCGSAALGRLYIRLVHLRRVKTMSLPVQLYADEWNASRQEIVHCDPSRKTYIEEAGEYILHIRNQFENAIQEFSLAAFHTVEELASVICPQWRNKDHLSRYAILLARQMEKAGKERTARAYRSSVAKLERFVKGRTLYFSDITPMLLKKFEEDMKSQGKSLNTISFYMRNLRVIYNKALEEGLIYHRANPFKGVYTGFWKTPKRALRTTQMQSLQEMEYSVFLEKGCTPSCADDLKLYTAWRYFIFCFHARGMCFVDLAHLRKENICLGVIRYYRKKTGGLIEVRITPIMRAILDSFAHQVCKSPYLFPIITDIGKKERVQYENGLRMQNRRLKELTCRAGLAISLTTHVSRHSWASIAKQENLPLWVISEGLGHSNEKTTYTYLAQLERSRLDSANDTVCAVVNRNAEQKGSAKITTTKIIKK